MNVPAASATDTAGNGNTLSNTLAWTYDTPRRPCRPSTASTRRPTNAASVNWTVTFSEPVTGVERRPTSRSSTAVATGASITGVTRQRHDLHRHRHRPAPARHARPEPGRRRLDRRHRRQQARRHRRRQRQLHRPGLHDRHRPRRRSRSTRPPARPIRRTTSPINFTVVFSESVTGFTTGDVTLSGTAGATTATVTGSGTTYNVAVSGMTTTAPSSPRSRPAARTDAAGNVNTASTSTDNTVTYDATRADGDDQPGRGQADPTNASPINFTVVFSESVTGFAAGDVTLSGTAGATTATVTGSGTTYNVAVSGMTSDGTVIATHRRRRRAATRRATATPPRPRPTTRSPTTPRRPTVTINQAGGPGRSDQRLADQLHGRLQRVGHRLHRRDVTLTGTAGATTATGHRQRHDLQRRGQRHDLDGTVIASDPGRRREDAAGNLEHRLDLDRQHGHLRHDAARR